MANDRECAVILQVEASRIAGYHRMRAGYGGAGREFHERAATTIDTLVARAVRAERAATIEMLQRQRETWLQCDGEDAFGRTQALAWSIERLESEP